MSVSKAKRRKQSANIIAARRTNNPTSVIATGDGDRMRTGNVVAPRKVLVTARVSIKQRFTAPRHDMGEYVPVSTHNAELAKYGKDWTA